MLCVQLGHDFLSCVGCSNAVGSSGQSASCSALHNDYCESTNKREISQALRDLPHVVRSPDGSLFSTESAEFGRGPLDWLLSADPTRPSLASRCSCSLQFLSTCSLCFDETHISQSARRPSLRQYSQGIPKALCCGRDRVQFYPPFGYRQKDENIIMLSGRATASTSSLYSYPASDCASVVTRPRTISPARPKHERSESERTVQEHELCSFPPPAGTSGLCARTQLLKLHSPKKYCGKPGSNRCLSLSEISFQADCSWKDSLGREYANLCT